MSFFSLFFCLDLFIASLVKVTLWNINFTLKFSREKKKKENYKRTQTHRPTQLCEWTWCICGFLAPLPFFSSSPPNENTLRLRLEVWMRLEIRPKTLHNFGSSSADEAYVFHTKNLQLYFQAIQFNTTIFHASWIANPPRTCRAPLNSCRLIL